jgi:hypothetical protein
MQVGTHNKSGNGRGAWVALYAQPSYWYWYDSHLLSNICYNDNNYNYSSCRCGKSSDYQLLAMVTVNGTKYWLQQLLLAHIRYAGLGSRPVQYVWDLWWTKWQWDRFSSEFFGLFLSIASRRGSLSIYHPGGRGVNNRPVGGLISETEYQAINMNNNNDHRLISATNCWLESMDREANKGYGE